MLLRINSTPHLVDLEPLRTSFKLVDQVSTGDMRFSQSVSRRPFELVPGHATSQVAGLKSRHNGLMLRSNAPRGLRESRPERVIAGKSIYSLMGDDDYTAGDASPGSSGADSSREEQPPSPGMTIVFDWREEREAEEQRERERRQRQEESKDEERDRRQAETMRRYDEAKRREREVEERAEQRRTKQERDRAEREVKDGERREREMEQRREAELRRQEFERARTREIRELYLRVTENVRLKPADRFEVDFLKFRNPFPGVEQRDSGRPIDRILQVVAGKGTSEDLEIHWAKEIKRAALPTAPSTVRLIQFALAEFGFGAMTLEKALSPTPLGAFVTGINITVDGIKSAKVMNFRNNQALSGEPFVADPFWRLEVGSSGDEANDMGPP